MTYITIKYGVNEERLANPNVLSSVLLHHLKTTCGFGDLTENVDLASETGEVIDLINKSKEYAKRFVDARGTYILVKAQGDDTDDTSPTYTSLLEQTGVEKLKFSVSRQRNKIKAGARGDAPARRGDKDDDADTRGGAAPTTAATGAAAKRGPAGTSNSKSTKGVSSGFSSTTSLYEASNPTGGTRRGKTTTDKAAAAGAATNSASNKNRKR
ncbi:hypothetical protein PhCBS80983_g04443 [Powellomyces hirtus]|uniref:Uncharacterized protein n=1 Tax=Powellomyces hirtus TaxID=109895 RepID=A0A507E051_9FUNG|nr:hypothetical protein PhCBS80983_g04443 [Powellomyces hirtus]